MSQGIVLFVDDEENILNSLRRGLIDEEYECIFASSGKDALEVIRKREVSVIVTDMRMPEMDGLTLLKEVKKIAPDTIKIVLSGYTQLQQVLVTINQGEIFKFITKPWKLDEEFKVIINQALEYYNLRKDSENLKKSLEMRNTSYKNMIQGFEEKISVVKNESSIKNNGNQLIVEHLLNLLDVVKDGGNNELDINFEKDFYKCYKDNLKLELEEIDVKAVLDDFVKFSEEYYENGNLKKEYKFPDNYKIKTNKTIIDHFLKYTLMSIINKNDSFNMKIMGHIKYNVDNEIIEFVFDIVMLNGVEANNLVKKNRLQFISLFINEHLKIYNGSLKFGEVEDRIIIKLDLGMKIKN